VSRRGMISAATTARRHASTLPGWICGCAVALLGVSAALGANHEPIQRIEITARPIASFKLGSTEKNFGPLEFVGGLEMSSTARDLGALSAFRFRDSGQHFVGVADTGFWFYGAIQRDAGKPSGVSDFRMVQMTDRAGNATSKKWDIDAEGLGLRGNTAVVGYEREHRVVQYALQPDFQTKQLRELDFLVPAHELRNNRGFETIAFSPEDGPTKGALVIVSEKSLDKAGNIFAAVLSGPRKGIFTIKRSDTFDITDGAFLPNGDLLLLERAFSMATGVGLRLRRIPAELINKGVAAADGPILIQADMSYQIDNMEGMDIWRREDGAIMVSLMSDDNHSMLQRNLYLEFVLHED
jgi:hypothetical protein